MLQLYHGDRSAWGASHRDLGDRSAWGAPHRDLGDRSAWGAPHRDLGDRSAWGAPHRDRRGNATHYVPYVLIQLRIRDGYAKNRIQYTDVNKWAVLFTEL